MREELHRTVHPGLGWDLGRRVPTLRERSQQPPVSPGWETEQPEGAEWGKRPPCPFGPARGSREPLCRRELPERKRPPGPVHTLTGTRKDICIFLIGAQQAHQLRGLHVIQGEEADVILGGRGVTSPPLHPDISQDEEGGWNSAGSQVPTGHRQYLRRGTFPLATLPPP